MRIPQIVVGCALLGLLLVLSVSPLSSQAQDRPQSPAYQLLVNPGVEVYDPPYGQYEGVDCQVATGWQRFWYGGPEPYWMDCRVFADSHLGVGWVDRIEGETSQLVFATEPYTAGIRQQVMGLTPGVGYGFHAALLTIYQTSAPPSVDGTMIKQVGMDPTGGTDPQAPTVVWSEADDLDEAWSIDLRTAAYAQVPTMTVFVQVESPYPAGDPPFLNLSFLDSAILARTPTVAATSPAVSESPSFVVDWDNALIAPGGGKLKWRDVQWLDEAEGVWHDWLTRTYETQALFVGDWGHAYRFRARAWQRYPNGAHLCGPYRSEGDTQTFVLGPRLTGQVLNHVGQPVAGATVAISGTTYAASSGARGQYGLDVVAWPGPQVVTVSHPAWSAPPPVYDVSFGPTGTVTLTWTLGPAGDAIVNGDFEAELAGWSVGSGPALTPTVVTEPVHSGHYALSLGGRLPLSEPLTVTAGLSQTVVLTAAWEPALAFWYRTVSTDSQGLFNVVLTVVTETITTTLPPTPTVPLLVSSVPLTGPITTTLAVTMTYVFTPALEPGDWLHQWYPVGRPNEVLTATVTVEFRWWAAGDDELITVYLDEIRLGPSPGGPFRGYLPLILR